MSSIDPGLIAAAARDAALNLMTDTCRVERTGPVQTSEDGQDTTPSIVLYEGPCRLKPAATAIAVARASATTPTETWHYKLSIPYSTSVVFRSADAVVITGSQDPSIADLRLRVSKVDRGTHISAHRLWCTEVSR